MPEFTFAHISDLHFSQGRTIGGNHTHSIDLLKGIRKHLNGKSIDRLIISGDITDEGDSESLQNAYDWIFRPYNIGGDKSSEKNEEIGLNMPPKSVGIVPGNHDAYNKSGGCFDIFKWAQESIDNYNNIFTDHTFKYPSAVNYDWIEKENRGVFIVFVETSFIDDPEYDSVPINKIAKGKIHKNQSRHILELFQKGIRGELAYPTDESKNIPKEIFSTSLKILTAHHYLFEPPGAKNEHLLQIEDAREIFIDLASADFDIYLCGHKHFDYFDQKSYGDHLDKRGKSRHLLNLFKRSLGIEMLPIQVKDNKGKLYSKVYSLGVNVIATFSYLKSLFWTNTTKENSENYSDGDFTEQFVETLQKSLREPQKLEKNITNFLKKNNISADEVLNADDLRNIHNAIAARFSSEEIKKIESIGKNIEKLARNLSSRPFIQIMAGSAAKRSKRNNKKRSFNIYRILADDEGYNFTGERYVWDNGLEKFEQRRPYFDKFNDSHRSIHV